MKIETGLVWIMTSINVSAYSFLGWLEPVAGWAVIKYLLSFGVKRIEYEYTQFKLWACIHNARISIYVADELHFANVSKGPICMIIFIDYMVNVWLHKKSNEQFRFEFV